MSTTYYDNPLGGYIAITSGPKEYRDLLVVFTHGDTSDALEQKLIPRDDLCDYVQIDVSDVPEEWLVAFEVKGAPRPKAKKPRAAPKAQKQQVELVLDLEPGDEVKGMCGLFLLATMMLFSVFTIVRMAGLIWNG